MIILAPILGSRPSSDLGDQTLTLRARLFPDSAGERLTRCKRIIGSCFLKRKSLDQRQCVSFC